MNVHAIPRKFGLQYHPACEMYPRLSDKDYLNLKEDIATHGLREPIVVWRDERDEQNPVHWILDGRHRFEAICELRGSDGEAEILAEIEMINPEVYGSYEGEASFRFVSIESEEEAYLYVQSLNTRRDMTQSQRAVVAAIMWRELQVLKDAREDSELNTNLRKLAAKRAGVSEGYLTKARQVLEESPPELVDLVQSGECSLGLAKKALTVDMHPDDLGEVCRKEGAFSVKKLVEEQEERDRSHWYTPQEILLRIKAMVPAFDLDVASCEEANRAIKAKRFYTEHALRNTWEGRVFCCPPDRGRRVGKWARRMAQSYKVGQVVHGFLVTEASPWEEWFQEATQKGAVAFVRGVKFDGPGAANAPKNIAVFYFGPDTKAFYEAFNGYLVFPPRFPNTQQETIISPDQVDVDDFDEHGQPNIPPAPY